MSQISSWNRLYELEEKIRCQNIVLNNGFATAYRLVKDGEGVEVLAKADLPERIERNSYYINRILYYLREILEKSCKLLPPDLPAKDASHMPAPEDLSFMLDGFLMASATLIESPLRENTEKLLTGDVKKEFNYIFPKRDDPNSLYWRLNLLRNRAVHFDGDVYATQHGVLQEFTSEFYVVISDGKIVELPTNLIDMADNEQLKPAVQVCIDNKEISLMDAIFGKGKPSGAPRKNQQLIYATGLKRFDIVKGFPSICDEVLDLIDKIHHVYAKWYVQHVEESEFEKKWRIGDNDKVFIVKDLFPDLKIPLVPTL